MLRFVGIHVLADFVAPTVEVVDDMFDRENAHHFIDVGQRFHLRGVRLRPGRVGRVNQGK